MPRLLLLLAALIIAGCAASDAPPATPSNAEPVAFETVILEEEANIDMWWARVVKDVNGDGLMDMIVQHRNAFGGWLGWYEAGDGGQTWTQHIIAETAPNDSLFAAGDLDAGDIDGDGDIDAIGISHPGEWRNAGAPADIYWYENVNGDGMTWTPHVIGSVPDAVKDINVADFNADGKLDLAVLTFEENTFSLFRQDSADDWSRVQFSTITNLHEGMEIGDIDGDDDLDIAANGYWLANPGGDLSGEWTVSVIDDIWHNQDGDWSRNATKHASYDLDGDGREEVFISHSERDGYPIRWYQRDPETNTWTGHTIADTLVAAHTLQLADFDLDGDIDVIAGVNQGRAVNIGHDTFPIYLYRNGGDNLTWTAQLLTEGGVYNGQVADLEGDGDPDFFRIASHEKGNFEVWINQTR
ncbi:MAG: VCBS repeat-containing protein [Bacteroidota bacterium]